MPLEGQGIHLCTGYEEISAVLRSPEFGADIARLTDRLLGEFAETARRGGGTVDFMEHFALRSSRSTARTTAR